MNANKRAPKRIPIDYSKGKIYKIVNTQNDMIYVDGTTTLLPQRMCSDKAKKLKKYVEEIGSLNFSIVLIENFPCKSKAELDARTYEIKQALPQDKLYSVEKNDCRQLRPIEQHYAIHEMIPQKTLYIQWRQGNVRDKETFSYRKRTRDEAMEEALARQAELRAELVE